MWGSLFRIAAKLAEKARGVDPSDVMTQSTGSDVFDIIRDLLW